MAESKVSFLLSKPEIELLESVLIFEPGLQDVTENIRKAANGSLAVFSETNIQEALEALSYAAVSIAKSAIEKEAYFALHNKIKEGFYRL
jgi:hypothetical protein